MLSLIIALAFTGFSAAQSTTSLLIPDADPQPLIASIIGSDTTATTYAIECVPGTDSNDCGFAGVFTLTVGPSTAAYTLSLGYEIGTSSFLAFTGYIDCALTGESAVCTESFGGDEANSPGISTITTVLTPIPVTITDSLPTDTALGFPVTAGSVTSTISNSPSPSTTKSAPTAPNTSSGKNTSAGESTSTSNTASGTGTAQSAGTTSSSTGGAAQAMVTGWVVGAAAVGLAFI